MTPVTLQFNPSSERPLTEGLKHVLFEVTNAASGSSLGHEWGFANFVFDTGFEKLEEGGVVCTVAWWAEAVSPQLVVG